MQKTIAVRLSRDQIKALLNALRFNSDDAPGLEQGAGVPDGTLDLAEQELRLTLGAVTMREREKAERRAALKR